jgi:hypothetical protein
VNSQIVHNRIPFCGGWRGAILVRIMPPVPSLGVGGTGGTGRAAALRQSPPQRPASLRANLPRVATRRSHAAGQRAAPVFSGQSFVISGLPREAQGSSLIGFCLLRPYSIKSMLEGAQ